MTQEITVFNILKFVKAAMDQYQPLMDKLNGVYPLVVPNGKEYPLAMIEKMNSDELHTKDCRFPEVSFSVTIGALKYEELIEIEELVDDAMEAYWTNVQLLNHVEEYSEDTFVCRMEFQVGLF